MEKFEYKKYLAEGKLLKEENYELEPEDMDNPDEDLVIIGSGYLDIKSNFKERPSQTNGEYAEIGQKVVDQLHKGDKDAAFNHIMSKINEDVSFGGAGTDKRSGQVIGDIIQLIRSTGIDPSDVMEEIGQEFGINFEFGRG